MTPDPETNNDQTPKMSSYEQSRAERIKQNLEKMQKLGLLDLSLKLKSLNAPKRTTPTSNNRSASKQTSTPKPSGPLRRSSRLQNTTPVSYFGVALTKKRRLFEGGEVKLGEAFQPEVYTEEDEKLLGSTERSWTLFVDGYGKDGRRIYDPINGKTCHQCRQKTLGYRTHCSKCNLVQGQFCGDCLYMRYGEHVLEALEDPNWICPVCRGICNCSLCRQGKGWPATGPLYRKVSSMGYKSVAHYLIQTQRSQNNLEKESVAINQISVKRSLPFSDMEMPSNESPLVKSEQIELLDFQYEDKLQDEFKNEKEEQISGSRNLATAEQTRRSLLLSVEAESENKESAQVNFGLSMVKLENKVQMEHKGEEDKEVKINITPKNSGKKHSLAFEPDSIAARIKQRRGESNGHHDMELTQETKKNFDAKKVANDSLFNEEVEKEKELDIENDRQDISIIPMPVGTSAKLKKKPAHTTEPSPESIGGRLRLRRRMAKGQDDDEFPGKNEQGSDVGQASDNISSVKEIIEINMKLKIACEDSIARRLRSRQKAT